MIRDLLYKERWLNQVQHPGLLAMLLLAALVLIPQWLYYIAFIYVFLVVMIIAQVDKANNDLVFAALLPVRKRDIVTARMWSIVGWELVYILVAAVCTAIRLWFFPVDNAVSMNTNFAFFGTIFLMYAIFNAIYLSGAYKSPYRMLWPLLGGTMISFAVVAVLNTIPIVISGVSTLFNDNGLGHLRYQLAALAAGIIAYAGATLWAHRKAVANFERVDL